MPVHTPEVTTQFIYSQLGVEAALGTEVPATIALGSTTITPAIQRTTRKFTPKGRRMPTVVALSKNYTNFSFDGPATYTEIGYFIQDVVSDSMIDAVGYTVEAGDVLTVPGCVVSDWSLKCTQDECTLSGNMVSIKPAEPKAGTAALAPAAQLPILPSEWAISLDSVTTLKWFEWSLNVSGLWSPAFYKGSVTPSNVVHTEIVATFQIKVEADAAGIALVGTPKAGVLAASLHADGTSGTSDALFAFDCQLDTVDPFEDNQGIYAYGLTYIIKNKATASIDTTFVTT